ncbi:hypothetical protein [Ferruginibacter sp.]
MQIALKYSKFENYPQTVMAVTKILKRYSEKQKYKRFINTVNAIGKIDLYKDIDTNEVHFKHSGPLGDIIYSLPAIKVLAGDKKIALHLNTNQDSFYSTKLKHYGNGKTLSSKSIAQLSPLLKNQHNFLTCDEYTNQPVDYDLDLFRAFPFDYRMGNIARWQFLTYGISADLSEPWLQVLSDTDYKNKIIISRSFRYRTPLLSYEFLKDYGNLVFVGLQDEYEDMKSALPDLLYQPVDDFLQLAKIISGCRLFIGNQSFPFALAEALKVRRALEVSFESPNVIVDGINGYDFCYQQQFEKIIRKLMT